MASQKNRTEKHPYSPGFNPYGYNVVKKLKTKHDHKPAVNKPPHEEVLKRIWNTTNFK